MRITSPLIANQTFRILRILLSSNHLLVVLGQQLLSQLDVLVLGLLLAEPSIDSLLPLVVLGLTLLELSALFPSSLMYFLSP